MLRLDGFEFLSIKQLMAAVQKHAIHVKHVF